MGLSKCVRIGKPYPLADLTRFPDPDEIDNWLQMIRAACPGKPVLV